MVGNSTYHTSEHFSWEGPPWNVEAEEGHKEGREHCLFTQVCSLDVHLS